MEEIKYLWQDRKRYFGLPLSFTRYFLSEDRLFIEEGLFHIKADEILLYRVRDIDLSLKLTERIFGVGTICVHSSDQSMPHLDLKHIKDPRMVKELIHRSVEQAKDKRRMKAMEVIGGENAEDCADDLDPDGLLDDETL